MSRFETNFTAASEARLSASELVALAGEPGAVSPERRAAIACYLAAGDGWREAVQALGGAFANDPTVARRLSGAKPE